MCQCRQEAVNTRVKVRGEIHGKVRQGGEVVGDTPPTVEWAQLHRCGGGEIVKLALDGGIRFDSAYTRSRTSPRFRRRSQVARLSVTLGRGGEACLLASSGPDQHKRPVCRRSGRFLWATHLSLRPPAERKPCWGRWGSTGDQHLMMFAEVAEWLLSAKAVRHSVMWWLLPSVTTKVAVSWCRSAASSMRIPGGEVIRVLGQVTVRPQLVRPESTSSAATRRSRSVSSRFLAGIIERNSAGTSQKEATQMVMTGGRGRTHGKIKIGADDPSLTGNGGMLAVTELCGKLGLIEALDKGIGPVKQRARGFTGGQVLAGMAAAQLAGEDFLVGLDRVRADQAGQQVTPVPGLATSTAAGIARRFTAAHWRGTEAGLAAATARMTALLPAERTAELAEGPVTIDIDATDVEVYGSKKRGVAYTYQGQRAGRPHVASWAETEIPLAADLLAGDQDPRSSVVALLGRALAALPRAVRDGAAAAGRKIALRADAGYFAGELARAAAAENMAFAIGAKRIASMWKALAGIGDNAWRDAIDMPNAQVAVSTYRPADWPEDTVLLVRRVKLDPDQVSADPRSRRRRTLHPDQRALPIPELEQEPAIYAYSFICTNLDVSTPARAAAVEHWYRHRTSIENIFRDSKHGAALRHLPSGHEQVNTAWMWASLIAAAIAAWLHQLTGLILGGELVEGHGVRGGKAMIATLRRRLIAVPARLVSHGGQLIMRLAPGPCLLPQVLAAIRALPGPAG